MHHSIKAILIMVLCLGTHVGFAESEGLYTSRSLSLELASKAVDGAIKDCRKKGYSVAVAVVDRGGNVTALLRDRFAGPHTIETAIRKAWT
ncbi:MAG: heme-binding protein, partial [Candidatus Thiodiazotropha endolucinida]|nr:heme-binding protein [Candidatus Thiodiazotropha taylori]MCW4239567.1 heme-binding protein [Candidatus Thiodiazotropha taylori]